MESKEDLNDIKIAVPDDIKIAIPPIQNQPVQTQCNETAQNPNLKPSSYLSKLEVTEYLKENDISILANEYKSKFVKSVKEKTPLDDAELCVIYDTINRIRHFYRKSNRCYDTMIENNKAYFETPVLHVDTTLEALPEEGLYPKPYIDKCMRIVIEYFETKGPKSKALVLKKIYFGPALLSERLKGKD